MTHKWNKILLLIAAIPSVAFAQGDEVRTDSVVRKHTELQEIAYGKQPAWLVTGALSQVSGAEMEKTFTTNLQNTLIGRIPGLTVTQGSDEAGVVNNTLRARGVATYQGGQDLLVLVDGFRSSFAELVSQEIESVTLLKDASATAIYGLRGANGVLLVTTKRGVNAPLKVSFSTQVGFQKATRLPRYLGSYDFARLYNEGQRNDGAETLKYSDDDLDNYRSGGDPYLYPDVDWTSQMLRDVAPIYNVDLNFRGGDKVVRYFVLMNVIGNNGLLQRSGDMSDNSINQSYTRYNVRSNVDVNITKRFSAAVTLGLSVADWNTPGAQNASTLLNTASMVNPNSFPIYNPNGTFGGNSTFSNPVGDLLETGYWSSNSRIINTAIKITEQLDMITPGLSVSASVAFNSWYLGYSNKYKNYARFPVSAGGAGDKTGYVYGEMFGENTALKGDEGQSNQWRNMTALFSLDYSRTFGLNRFDAMAMYNYEEHILGAEQPYRHIGAGGRLTYTFDSKYIAEVVAGYQGSERFAVGRQYGFFPAVSLGWVASNEDFLKENEVVSFLKLRSSYGLTGNDEIGSASRFMYEDTYGITGGYPLGMGNNVIYGNGLVDMGNRNITWEKEKKFNIGFDASFFGALDVAFDYFNNSRSDILSLPNRNIPVYIGASLPMLNVGKVNNQGFEAAIRYHGKSGKELSYFVELTGWYSRNRIDYNSEPIKTEEYMYTTGRQIGQPYALIASGFYSQADIDNPAVAKPAWSVVQAGDIKYEDKNNDQVIDSNDWYPVGNTDLPSLTMGLNLGIRCYGFDLSAFFQGVSGRTVYLGSNYYKAFQGRGKVSEVALGRWTPETAATATYPRLSAADDLNNFQTSTFWQRNGSFIKLRTLELGYTFKNIIKSRDSDLRLFVNGNNLFSLDHISDTDPEVQTGYPVVRTFSFGAKIQF